MVIFNVQQIYIIRALRVWMECNCSTQAWNYVLLFNAVAYFWYIENILETSGKSIQTCQGSGYATDKQRFDVYVTKVHLFPQFTSKRPCFAPRQALYTEKSLAILSRVSDCFDWPLAKYTRQTSTVPFDKYSLLGKQLQKYGHFGYQKSHISVHHLLIWFWIQFLTVITPTFWWL